MNYKVKLFDGRILTVADGKATGKGSPAELAFMGMLVFDPLAYYPDYDLALALKIAEVYQGKIIERPPEQEYDPNIVY